MTDYPFIAKIFKNSNSLQLVIPMNQIVKPLNLKDKDWVRISNIEKIIVEENKKKDEKK